MQNIIIEPNAIINPVNTQTRIVKSPQSSP